MAGLHNDLMKLALREAEKAGQMNEVPIGAVLVAADGSVLSKAHNQTITRLDPTAHAEIIVLREAAARVGNYRLTQTTLYVTIEPCIMCMGALIHARVARIVFGAKDPKWGACQSLYRLADDQRLNHQPDIIGGVCQSECRNIIQNFFQSKRDAS
jgi:tRNA(adenine34) deaminase